MSKQRRYDINLVDVSYDDLIPLMHVIDTIYKGEYDNDFRKYKIIRIVRNDKIFHLELDGENLTIEFIMKVGM